MNKYQKEKSREIRDIMRTDPWRRMSYKEAKRKWRKGIRAFPVGSTHSYELFDLGRLGLSRGKMRELGKAYFEILEYTAIHGLDFRCIYDRTFDQYVLRFTGRNYHTGKVHGFSSGISSDVIRQSNCSLVFLAKYILEQLDHEVQTHNIGLKPNYRYVARYDTVVLPPASFILGR